MLFRVPESKAVSTDDQKKEDRQYVEDLLKVIKVNDEEDRDNLRPKKVYRLGKLDKNRNKPRPINVEFETKADQNLVINNAKNLRDAPSKFKNTNIAYDLSETDRQELGLLLNEAKEK